MAFSINETTLINAVNGGGIFSIINSTLSPNYGIYYSSLTKTKEKASQRALSPTSFIEVSRGRDASVTTAPVERGDYLSFNKVQRPAEISIIVTFEGWTGFSGSIPNLTNFTGESRAGFLAALDDMVSDTEIYDIETPDTVFTSYDLTKYDYKVNAREGVTMLTVALVFQAIQVIPEQRINPGQCINASVFDAGIEDVQAAINSAVNSISSALEDTASTVKRSVLGQGGEAQLDTAIKKLVGLLT